eukprot:TRINITY_DN75_c0_g2_i1.p1 TRINITY_DN75_c0_g2~~TRINITY_DN75_c0_g2_i1.p1  ORF type:complete len:481 (+),score=147.03 TRINITY_DN75_c0_g2_i1:69-1511(+)
MMKTVFVLFAVVCAFVVFAEEDSNVVVLTTDNFDSVVDGNEFVLVEFYAPWCGHCKKLAPEYEKAANALKASGSEVILAKVDATEQGELATRFNVKGYPTLFFFRDGSPIDYEGGRVEKEIISWVAKKSGPPSTKLTTAEEVEAFLAQDTQKVIGVFSDAESKEYTQYIKVATAKEVDEFTFAHVYDESLVSYPLNSVTVFNTEKKVTTYSDNLAKKLLIHFIMENGYPLAPVLDQKTYQRASTSGRDLLCVFIDDKNADELALLNEIATTLKDQEVIVSLAPRSQHERLAGSWGASGNVFPTSILVTFNNGKQEMIAFNEETETEGFNAETGVAFYNSAKAGTYPVFVKSEPIPESNDGPVTVIVGKTFNDIVADKSKNVLVEFYAPWCGHCKKLAPTYEELGTAFADNEDVIIAKIDATSNKIPSDIQVSGFPTLIFFPANSDNLKAGVKHNGDRDLAALTKFVNDNLVKPEVQKDDL